MIDRPRDRETALSLLVSDGLPNGAGSLAGLIDTIGRFDEGSGEVVPLAGLALPAGSTVCVAGWSADLHAQGAAAGVCIRVGEELIDAQYGECREDVAAAYGIAGFTRTGFRGYAVVGRAVRGPLEIAAVAVGADARSASVLPGSATLTVVAAAASTAFETPRRAGSADVRVDAWQLDSRAEVSFDETLLAPRGALIAVRGWARDATADAPVAGVFAVVDELDVVRGSAWQPRPDVAAVTRRDDLLASGFNVRIDTVALAPGWHVLQIGIVTADGEAYDLDERRFAFAVVPDHR